MQTQTQQSNEAVPTFDVNIVETGILITIPDNVQITKGDVKNVLEAVRDIMVSYATLQIEEKAIEAAEAALVAAETAEAENVDASV